MTPYNPSEDFGILPPPLIELQVEPQRPMDIDLPSDEGISDEAVQRLRDALWNCGYQLISVKNLGIGDK